MLNITLAPLLSVSPIDVYGVPACQNSITALDTEDTAVTKTDQSLTYGAYTV